MLSNDVFYFETGDTYCNLKSLTADKKIKINCLYRFKYLNPYEPAVKKNPMYLMWKQVKEQFNI